MSVAILFSLGMALSIGLVSRENVVETLPTPGRFKVLLAAISLLPFVELPFFDPLLLV